LAASRTN